MVTLKLECHITVKLEDHFTLELEGQDIIKLKYQNGYIDIGSLLITVFVHNNILFNDILSKLAVCCCETKIHMDCAITNVSMLHSTSSPVGRMCRLWSTSLLP